MDYNTKNKATPHTTYEIKLDSLGRYYERYATRVSTNKTSLNDRKKYDKNSNVIAFTSFNEDGQINSQRTYAYDAQNRLIARIFPKKIDRMMNGRYITSGTEKRVEYSYDDEDNLLSAKTLENGDLIRFKKYLYEKFEK